MTEKKNSSFSFKKFFSRKKDPLTAADKLVIIERSINKLDLAFSFLLSL